MNRAADLDRKVERGTLASLLLAIVICLSGCSAPVESGLLQVHFIDVGQGDSILVLAPDGGAALIDGGNADSKALRYLEAHAVQRLDLIIATHPHADHIGGLIEILKEIPVEKVITNGQATTTSVYESFLDAIADAHAEYAEVKRGDVIPFGDLSFSVLSPASTSGDDLNTNSIVLRLACGDTRFLFMGDAGADTEAEMLTADLPVSADLLKVGHHGSCYGTTLPFLQAVTPQTAVISVGRDNPYGHPCPDVIARLTLVGVMIRRTDREGTVVIETACRATLGTPTAVLTTPRPRAPVAIVGIECILYDGFVSPTESDEYVQIRNYGTEPCDLAGWLLKDITEGYPIFQFGDYVLPPGVAIRVYTNETHPEWGGFSFGCGRAIWNNTNPDTAALYDASGWEVARCSYVRQGEGVCSPCQEQ